MNSIKQKEGMAMKDAKEKVEISLDEEEQVTGGVGPGRTIFVCPKCNAHFRSFHEFEAHCRTEHNINALGNSHNNVG